MRKLLVEDDEVIGNVIKQSFNVNYVQFYLKRMQLCIVFQPI